MNKVVEILKYKKNIIDIGIDKTSLASNKKSTANFKIFIS